MRQLPLKERADLMAARKHLLTEYDDMKAMADRLRQRQPLASLALPALHWLSGSCIRCQRRNDSLLRIVSKPDSDTLYGDLLLWVIMPHSFSEEALGDLNEEFELKASTDRSAARAWYRGQVWSTLNSCIWRRIERFVAIATLIELAFRSHKK